MDEFTSPSIYLAITYPDPLKPIPYPANEGLIIGANTLK